MLSEGYNRNYIKLKNVRGEGVKIIVGVWLQE